MKAGILNHDIASCWTFFKEVVIFTLAPKSALFTKSPGNAGHLYNDKKNFF